MKTNQSETTHKKDTQNKGKRNILRPTAFGETQPNKSKSTNTATQNNVQDQHNTTNNTAEDVYKVFTIITSRWTKKQNNNKQNNNKQTIYQTNKTNKQIKERKKQKQGNKLSLTGCAEWFPVPAKQGRFNSKL